MVFERPASSSMVQKLARLLRWAGSSAAMALAVAGCGGGDGSSLTAQARAQRDQAAAMASAQQSVTALMSAAVQPGSASEDFESGMADWQNWGNAQVAAGQGVSGNIRDDALQVGTGPGGAALQVPDVVGGTAYRLTAQVRVTNPDEPADLGVDFYDASGNRLIGTRAPGVTSTAFATFTFDVVAPANTAYALVWVWKNGSTGFAYVDDLAFGVASGPSPPPPAPPESNLVSNGGFEAGMTGWVDWGNTRVVSDQANSGASALSVGPAAGGAGHTVEGIVPGTTYRLVAHAKVSDPSETVFVGVNFLNQAGTVLHTTQLSATSTSYTTLSADIPAMPDAVRAVVYVWKNAGSGFGFVDDFVFGVAPGSAPPPPPPSGNLVVNGGFEDGLANWMNWGNTVASPSQAAAGSSAAQVGTGAGGFGQNVSGIVAGNTYRASAQVKVSSPDEVGYFGLKFLDGAGSQLQDALVPFSSTAYAGVQVEGVAPPNATSALVYVWKNAGSGFAFVDEVALTQVGLPGQQPPRFVAQPVELVNGTTAGDQVGPHVAALANGGHVIVWSQGSPTTGWTTLGQKFDGAGRKVGPELQLHAGARADAVAGLPDGGFAVVMSTADGSTALVLALRVDAAGVPVGTAQTVITTGGDGLFLPAFGDDIDVLPDGGYLVTARFNNPRPPAFESHYVRRFDASGLPVGEPLLVDDSDIAGMPGASSVLANGSWVTAWGDVVAPRSPSSNVQTFARIFNGSGTPLALLNPNPNPDAQEIVPTVATLQDGRFVLAWAVQSFATGTVQEIQLQAFDASGVASSAVIGLGVQTLPTLGGPQLTPLADGGFLLSVARAPQPGQDSSTVTVLGQYFDAGLQPTGALFELGSAHVAGSGAAWSVAALRDGGFVFVSELPTAGSAMDIYQRRFAVAPGV